MRLNRFLVSIFFITSFVTSEHSLFDSLPNAGALLDPDYTHSQHSYEHNSLPSELTERKVTKPPKPPPPLPINPTPSPPPKSLLDSLPNHGALNPSSKSRPPRDSLDWDITRITPTNEFDMPYWDNRFLTPVINAIASRPPPPNHQRLPPPPQFRQFHSNMNNQGPRGTYGPPPPHPPQRKHGPPTYTYSKHPPRDEHNKTYTVSANSGGPTVIVYAHPNKKDPQNEQKQVPLREEEVKNEIHYHYHINGEETKHKGHQGHQGYGRPPPPPPQHQRRRPMTYGPPPPPSKPSKGPYPNSIQQNIYRTLNPEPDSHTDNFDDPFEEDFERRTFVTPSKSRHHNQHSYSNYRPADSISLTQKTPSTSYEVPPSSNAPSSTYGAPQGPSPSYGPPPEGPSPSYGPPTVNNPPAPPPQDQPQGADQYETTITLQTIPVTRQVTELVQVPNVVHKISSNRPQLSEQQQDDFSQVSHTPSSGYGAPAPSPNSHHQHHHSNSYNKQKLTQNQNIPQSSRGRDGERPFDTHLQQILGVGPTQNPKDAVLQELLLSQARTQGFDLTLNDLELISLLGNKGQGSNLLQQHHQPYNSRNILGQFGNLFGGNSGVRNYPVLNPGSGNQGLFGGSGSGDGLGSLRDAFREQRFQLALADLRKQLKEQNRDNVRERSSYRSMFTKGALLLSALTLLPSFMNPMAAAAGVGSASAASTIPNFMLPVTAAGRRKRSLDYDYKNYNPLKNGTNYIVSEELEGFLDCLTTLDVNKNSTQRNGEIGLKIKIQLKKKIKRSRAQKRCRIVSNIEN